MGLLQFLRVIWARRMVVLASTISCLLAALAVAYSLPERYEARSRLILEVVKPDPVTGEVIASPFAKAYTKTQIELIRDERVAGQVVDKLGLQNSPELRSAYASREEKGGGTSFRRWLSERIMNNIEARLVDGSNILEITAVGSSAEEARALAEAVRQAYASTSLSLRKENAGRTAQWYDQQLEKARASLAEAETAKTSFERQNGLILEAGGDVDSARLQALAGQSVPGGGGVAVSGGAATSPSAAQLAQVDAAIAAASGSLGPNHPEMQDLQKRRAALAGQVARDRAASSAAAGAASRSAIAGSGAANRAYEAQRAKVLSQRGQMEKLRQLQSELDIRRDQYVKTAARAAELRQEAEVSDAGITLLGAAITPESPVSPNKPLIIGAALALGFAFGILLSILLELLDRRVRSADDVWREVDVPLLAVISSTASTAANPPQLHWSEPRS